MKHEILSRRAYHETMLAIYKLMDKGAPNLSEAQLKKEVAMSVAVERYENEVLGLRPKKKPQTVLEAIELKMLENKLTKTRLAAEIGMGQSKVSEILSGKRRPDLPFLRGVHKILKIDAEFLLEHA